MKIEKLTFCLKSPEPVKRKRKNYRKGILMAFTALLFLLGCNTYQKQLNTFRAFAISHTNELAPLCATVFPVKDSTGKAVTTIDSTHRANNINLQPKVDSLQTIADSYKKQLAADTGKSNPCAAQAKQYQAQYGNLYNEFIALKKAYRPCKPDTVYSTKTVPIYQKDEAEITVLTNNYNAIHDSLTIVKTQLKASQSTASTRLHWIFILGGILLALGILTVLKFIGKI